MLWLDHLKKTQKRLTTPDRPARIALIGVGNELLADDTAGLVIIRELQERLSPPPWLLLLYAGPVPENHTGSIRHFKPDLVLLIDSAHFGGKPGEVRWLSWKETEGLSASTHTLPPYVLAEYLTSEMNCEVALLGIQPVNLTLDMPLSPQVRRSIHNIVTSFINQFKINH